MAIKATSTTAVSVIPLTQDKKTATACGITAKIAECFFQTASLLTDPICKMRENFVALYMSDELYGFDYEGKGKCTKEGLITTYEKELTWKQTAKKMCFIVWTVLKFYFYATVGLALAPVGIVLRAAGNQIRSSSFSYQKGNALEKELPEDKAISMLTWNICGVKGGYQYTDGGVLPIEERLGKITQYICDKDSDVVCLNEVFDIAEGRKLCSALKNQYAHFYYNMGPRATGLSSGMFVASKYAIDSPEFVPFSKDFLAGRTKNAEKGVFSVGLKNKGQAFARVYITHPQHSENCSIPSDEEKKCRKATMEFITEKMQKEQKLGVAQILTGDMNLSAQERDTSTWYANFKEDDTIKDQFTWVGDFGLVKNLAQHLPSCIGSPDKKFSAPLKYDYAFILGKENPASITTKIDAEDIGYKGVKSLEPQLKQTLEMSLSDSTIEFKPSSVSDPRFSKFIAEALSDHLPLSSTIQIV